MYLPSKFFPGISGIIDEEEIENCMENQELTERLRKTLYYGKLPTTDRPSLPVTEIAVEFFQDAAPRQLGQVDSFIASSYGRRACMSPCSMMLGMLYIERLKKLNPEYLTNASSSELFLISMMIASKYLYDEGVDEEVFNDEWAESANMEVEQLNELERNFLAAIDWNLFVQPNEFWKMLHRIERRIAYHQGRERGFFNYTDLTALTEDGALFRSIRSILLEMSKVLTVFSVAYVAGVLTVVGSTESVLYTRQQLPALEDVIPPFPSLTILTRPKYESWPAFEMDQQLSELVKSHSENAVKLDATSSEHVKVDNTSMTKVPYKTDSNERAVDETILRQHRTQQQTSSLQLPGFLTLVMLKDTVLHFMSSAYAKSTTNGHSKAKSAKQSQSSMYEPTGTDEDIESDEYQNNSFLDTVCSCGCCDNLIPGYNKLCYNLTTPTHFDEQNMPNHAKGHLAQGHKQNALNVKTEQMNCPPDYACQCCCVVIPPKRTDAIRDQDHLNFLESTLPLTRIEEPFAGLTFGYGTAPSLTAAAG